MTYQKQMEQQFFLVGCLNHSLMVKNDIDKYNGISSLYMLVETFELIQSIGLVDFDQADI